MSHFTVLVIGDDIKKELAPFDENIEVLRIKNKQEHINDTRKEIQDYKNGMYAKYLENPEEYLNDCSNEKHNKYISEEFPKKLEWSDEQCHQDALKWYEEDEINEDGSTNETSNPNSQWDWYQIGGRWQGMLQLKENCSSGEIGEVSLLDNDKTIKGYDSALIKDIDLDKMREKRISHKKESYREAFKKIENGEFKKENLEFMYGIKEDDTEESYSKTDIEFGTFAVLKDGIWYERGSMGWWGCVSEEKDSSDWDKEFNKLLQSLDGDTRITIVDCHI